MPLTIVRKGWVPAIRRRGPRQPLNAMNFTALLGLALLGFSSLPAFGKDRAAAPSEEINTVLMHSTFRISGPKAGPVPGTSFGTIFIVATAIKGNDTVGQITVVTAAHVLEDIAGDEAIVLVRKLDASGNYVPFEYRLKIRDHGVPLYVKHPTADVAAMYAEFPDEVPMSGLRLEDFATDEMLKRIEVHPGDEVFVLGFPLAAAGPGGFPILRSGHVASYPITPMKDVKTIYFDLFIFGGNSGGPVYYSFPNKVFGRQINLGLWQGLLGLVIQETRSALPEFADKPLNFGVVVPATFITETIARLPPPPEPSATPQSGSGTTSPK